MPSATQVNRIRINYLELVKRLLHTVSHRSEILSFRLCPRMNNDEADRKMALAELAVCKKSIASDCDALRKYEQRHKNMGMAALFNSDPTDAVRVAVAYLITKAFTDIVDSECRTVSRLASASCGNSVDELVQIREAFSATGILRPYCHVDCSSARTVDELSNIALTEHSIVRLLGFADSHNNEFDALLAARDLVQRNRR